MVGRNKMSACLRMKAKRKGSDETSFSKNGGLLLEKLVGSCDRKCNPIRCFSIKELNKATNNYANYHVLCNANNCILYKGTFQDRPICIKKFVPSSFLTKSAIASAIDDIVISSQMSVHNNALKLIGCCLETEIPIPVYEFAENGTLAYSLYGSHGTQCQPLLWKCRLRIATEIANVVAYLHTALSRPVVHRDIKPENFLLNQHNVAKLFDFSYCISIPDGKSHAEDVVIGTYGIAAPEYVETGFLNEKADVYAFGMLLLVLLTGQRIYDCKYSQTNITKLSDRVKYYVENNRFSEIVDPAILEKAGWQPEKEQQLQDFTAVALRCIIETEEDRPTIIDVAKQLRQIDRRASC